MSTPDSNDVANSISFLDERQNLFVRIQSRTGKRIDQLFSEMSVAGAQAPDEPRLTLIGKHGLDEEEADFLIGLAGEVDATAVARDKELLKRSFTYRNFRHDLWEVLLEDLDRPFFGATNLLGLSHYGPASEFLEECYYEKDALEPLVTMYGDNKAWNAAFFDPLLARLEKAGRFDLIERFCATIARRARAEYFVEKALLKRYGDHARVETLKTLALEAYERAIEWMTRLHRADQAQRFAQDRDMLREEIFPELPPVSDLRRIDEPVFWEIIRRSRSTACETTEQLAILGELLTRFAPAEIQRFGKHYANHMRKLYHWNVWALAYAARGGCSDDGFMEFRTWLILQGDPALLDLAIQDPTKAAERVPKDVALPEASLLPMIDEAHLRRKGTTPTLPSIDLERPKGREWPEDKLEERFPDLVRCYS
jgi:hypothetical protein